VGTGRGSSWTSRSRSLARDASSGDLPMVGRLAGQAREAPRAQGGLERRVCRLRADVRAGRGVHST